MVDELRAGIEREGAQPCAETAHVGADDGGVVDPHPLGAVGAEEVRDPAGVTPLGRGRRFEARPHELPVEHAVVPLGPTVGGGPTFEQHHRHAPSGELVGGVRPGGAGADHDRIDGPRVPHRSAPAQFPKSQDSPFA